MSYIILDSYTGLYWCGAALHLLDEDNRSPDGRCLACQRLRAQRRRRAEKALKAQKVQKVRAVSPVVTE